MGKDNLIETENNVEIVPQSKSKITNITLESFLSNSTNPIVRKASDYLYIGFRKFCEIQKYEYRASELEWVERFKKYSGVK